MKADLRYIDDGMFTRFIPDTKAGEEAYNEIANQCGGVAAVFSCHKESTLRQLRAAGYTVRKNKPSKCVAPWNSEDDELLAELQA